MLYRKNEWAERGELGVWKGKAKEGSGGSNDLFGS